MNRILSRNDIQNRIAKGQTILIYDHQVLRLDKWIAYHPGGAKAIYHMVGRDCTDEMNSYHCETTQATFKKFRVGKIDYKWENMLPPIQGGKYTFIEEKKANNDDDNHCDSDDTLIGDDNLMDKDQHSKLPGQPAVEIIPPIPQNMIFTIDKKFAYQQKVIRDPEDVLDNYDNQFVEKDLQMYPPMDYETQSELSEKYNQLHQRIIDANLYQCDYWSYFKEFCRIGSLFLWSMIFYKTNHLFCSAVAIGAAWQQSTFIVHDAAHISITHNYQFDSFIGMTIASFVGGLSSTWWKSNHNVHHLVTNDPVHDPDIQHLPFFAVSTKLFKNVYSTYYEKFLYYDKFSKLVIRIQDHLYYPMLGFGRFNLYRLSWTHLLLGLGPTKGKAAWFRWYELVGLSFFSYWFFYLFLFKCLDSPGQRWQYLLVSHISTMLVHVQITLSHFPMSTSDLGVSESFPSKQMRTTMDVDCPEWFDFIHGGLQFQAIHHLFPRLPRHNLRKAQPYVIAFCKDVGLKYTIYGFAKGNGKVLSRLGKIAQQAKILADCTKAMKEEARGTSRK
ncbi:hypothetical protein DASC09_027940 [Saccharomycopsis crataegensis]|uniref:Delta 8-(E)-sphingolipid desaturase n=1 Tax=Saccharomycopsis crataegensis TaxID=43959 RepID=A0AAV5QL68_9ASCO|nr:hypothetical protein DASC09_027940 [Saccharomycopsis crataegensis]